jgi:hypothetical protein
MENCGGFSKVRREQKVVLGVWLMVMGLMTSFASFHTMYPNYGMYEKLNTRPPVMSPPEADFGWWWNVPLVSAPVDHPPSVVYVFDTAYQIRYGNSKFMHMHGVAAFTDPSTHLIYLNPQKRDLRDSLMHELFHVMINQADEWDKIEGKIQERLEPTWSANHSWIVPLTPVILSVFKQNPKLVKWLAEGDK